MCPSYRFTELPDGRPGRQVTVVTPIRTDHGNEATSEEQTDVALASHCDDQRGP